MKEDKKLSAQPKLFFCIRNTRPVKEFTLECLAYQNIGNLLLKHFEPLKSHGCIFGKMSSEFTHEIIHFPWSFDVRSNSQQTELSELENEKL